jgi:hypothetical protein
MSPREYTYLPDYSVDRASSPESKKCVSDDEDIVFGKYGSNT